MPYLYWDGHLRSAHKESIGLRCSGAHRLWRRRQMAPLHVPAHKAATASRLQTAWHDPASEGRQASVCEDARVVKGRHSSIGRWHQASWQDRAGAGEGPQCCLLLAADTIARERQGGEATQSKERRHLGWPLPQARRRQEVEWQEPVERTRQVQRQWKWQASMAAERVCICYRRWFSHLLRLQHRWLQWRWGRWQVQERNARLCKEGVSWQAPLFVMPEQVTTIAPIQGPVDFSRPIQGN